MSSDGETVDPVEREIERLSALPLPALRVEWHHWHPDRAMPAQLPRDLLVRTIAWKLQEEAYGPFPAALTRKLERLAGQLERTGTLDLEREVVTKPGTLFVREWQGRTYRVVALADGFGMHDQHFSSLSEVARKITGTKWSGPRFFGLKQTPSGARVQRKAAA